MNFNFYLKQKAIALVQVIVLLMCISCSSSAKEDNNELFKFDRTFRAVYNNYFNKVKGKIPEHWEIEPHLTTEIALELAQNDHDLNWLRFSLNKNGIALDDLSRIRIWMISGENTERLFGEKMTYNQGAYHRPGSIDGLEMHPLWWLLVKNQNNKFIVFSVNMAYPERSFSSVEEFIVKLEKLLDRAESNGIPYPKGQIEYLEEHVY